MRKIGLLLVLASVGFSMSACATIVGGGSNQAVSMQSTPTGANYRIVSSSGLEMGQGATPATLSLPRKNEYQIDISMDGYQTQSMVLTRGTNGWIWGNLIVGWIVGFGVDFLTGSAYKLEPSIVQVTLQEIENETFAVVRLLNDDGRLIDERRLQMIPAN